MKKVIKHSKKGILMVTMFATLLSFANEAAFFNIKNDAKRTNISLRNVKEGNLLTIKSNTGITLYKEQIEKTGFYSKRFDLTALPDGDYTIELNKDVEISTIPFTVKFNTVVFNKDQEKTIFKPIVRVEGDLVYISKLSLDAKPLKINVYHNDAFDSENVYSEKISDTKTIERVFKLTGVDKNYKIVIHSEDREFTEYIN